MTPEPPPDERRRDRIVIEGVPFNPDGGDDGVVGQAL